MAERTRSDILPAALIGLGLLLGGWFIGDGFYEGRATARFVTVKGLAERFVEADLAVWPLRFTATGDDLGRVQADIERSLQEVELFLNENGVPGDAVQRQRVEVTDLLAQSYRPEGAEENRFIIAQTVIVRTGEVARVETLNRRTGELVRRGVVLTEGGGPSYLFTRLNEIKPEMLAEATENARAAAEQFAEDSGSDIAGIRRASQGLFQILARDEGPGIAEADQVDKKVRVVSTVDYLLD